MKRIKQIYKISKKGNKKRSCHLVPKVVIDLLFERRKVEGSRKYRRRERVPEAGSRREETNTEPITAKRLVRVSELEKEEVREVFVILLVNERDRIRNNKSFKCRRRVGNVQRNNNDMCSKGVWLQKYRKEKRVSAWWDEEIKETVREKRRLFEICITDRNEKIERNIGKRIKK